MKKKPCIVLTGPTAVGKTALSISLAKEINGEIISADSMQVYRLMDIGSAKITSEEMQGVAHFLVDELMPDEEFNVVKFQKLAKKYMSEIYARNHIPILVGGTGFYIQSLVYDIDFSEIDQTFVLRKQLEQFSKEKGVEPLHEKLRQLDPVSAMQIHPNNVKRVIRAIEFFELTGQRISEHNEQQGMKTSPYELHFFVLNDERFRLYERINQRVDEMLKKGLVEEVKMLKELGYSKSLVSMQGLGYKEILDYLDDKLTLEEAISTIKRDTRHYAKRQITWFKREADVCWINKPDFDYSDERILQFMLKNMQQKTISNTIKES